MNSLKTAKKPRRVRTMRLIPFALLLISQAALTQEIAYRQLPIETYKDKVAGGWLGQAIGVFWA